MQIRKLFLSLSLAALAQTTSSAQTIGAVVNVADYRFGVTFHSIAAMFGTDLADQTCTAAELPLPTELCGTSVVMRDATGAARPSPLFYVSPTQINFQVPVTAFLEPAAGQGLGLPQKNLTLLFVDVCVKDSCIPVSIEVQAPAIFEYQPAPGILDPIIVHVDGSLITSENPARWGETLVLYATGFGWQDASFPLDGHPAPLDRLIRIVDEFAVHIVTGRVGELPIGDSLHADFAGLAPGLVALVQFNFQLSRAYENREPLVEIFLEGSLDGQSKVVGIHVDPLSRTACICCTRCVDE